ncbi:MAG: glycosyltransferase family 2 protein [Bacteroidia bacterium]
MAGKTHENFLSVVIITHNEEKNIERCLASVQGIADEILVVDSFSTDATEQICKEFPVRFVQHEWMGYSQTKNFANTLARHNWIFSLDADEVLSPALQNELAQTKSGKERFFTINRLNNYCGKWIRHSGWYPDYKVRLFDRRQAKWVGDYVHEKLELEAGIVPRTLNGVCYHFTISSVAQHVEQINKFSTLSALELKAKGKHFSIWKVVFSPGAKFFSTYFIRRGFMDGFYGFVIAVLSAYSRFLRYTKLYQLNSNARERIS